MDLNVRKLILFKGERCKKTLNGGSIRWLKMGFLETLGQHKTISFIFKLFISIFYIPLQLKYFIGYLIWFRSRSSMAACGRRFSSGACHRAHLGRLASPSDVPAVAAATAATPATAVRPFSRSLGYCRGLLCPALSVGLSGCPPGRQRAC